MGCTWFTQIVLKMILFFHTHTHTHAGIGRALVKALAQCGAEVIAFSRTQSDLDSLKHEVKILFFLFLLVLIVIWSFAVSEVAIRPDKINYLFLGQVFLKNDEGLRLF